MDKVVIFGVGSSASRAYWYFTHDSQYQVVAFTVDPEYITTDKFFELPVISFKDVQTVFPPSEHKMHLPINSTLFLVPERITRLRQQKCRQAKEKGYQLANYISSRSITWPGLVIGDNCRILPNAVVEPFAQIGNDVFLGVGSLISHHSVIKDHCTIIHHAVILGEVTVEPYCFIGANATIRDGVTIARECIIGAGALILEDTQEKGIYRGNPAVKLPLSSDDLQRI